MLSRSNAKPLLDLSIELADEIDWQAGTLRTFEHHLDITAWAYEAVSGIIAIGTSDGSIDLYGGPGVEHRLELSERIAVRSLHFASSIFRLVCVDEKDRLAIWDLNTPRKPKLQSIVNFKYPVNSVTVSPSHSHVFVALANGEIQTYDLLCSRKSLYTMPDLWALYEAKMASSGMPDYGGGQSQLPIEMVVHPRDLNLLFVAYSGGVVMSDLTERNTARAYEYVVPPGAPGGQGYHDQNLLKHRRPDVTALAIHPCGHFFAAGYTDGSIAFWAIEDEDKPLLVLTLDGQHDINIADAHRLDEALGQSLQHATSREPVFRLAWSGFANSDDPRGGDTVLVVLGGLKTEDISGITAILLPAFNPAEPPALPATSSTTLHPNIRTAMRQSVTPKNLHTYSTVGTPQDFLLLPRESPHFSGSWNPRAILLLSDGAKGARSTEAYEFPPPAFGIHKNTKADVPSTGDSSDQALSDEIASTLESMKMQDDPKSLDAPPAFWSGPTGVIGGDLINFEKESYQVLVSDESTDDALGLHGGSAWIDDDEGQMKVLRFQPRRLLVTYHSDLTVRFRDLSAQLLLSSDTSPLQASYPNPLPGLTIDVLALLADPTVASRTSPTLLEEAAIASAHLAPQSLECAVVLGTGEVAVYRLNTPPSEDAAVPKTLEDSELISATHVSVERNHFFYPAFVLSASRGSVSALAMSDIGFLAVAHKDGSVFVVDMRGPRIILRDTSDKSAHRRSFLHRNEVDAVVSMTWTVAGTDTDIFPRVRLLATRDSGATTIYPLSRSADGVWAASTQRETTEGVSHAIRDASFVIGTKLGAPSRADRAGLAEVIHSSAEDAVKGASFWVTAGAKGVKCVVDITGERIGRADWPSKAGRIENVVIVRKNTSTLLIAYTNERKALVYSLPYLEHMHSLQLPKSSDEPLSVDETGDYVEWTRHPCGLIHATRYGTVFDVRRSGPYDVPQVDFTAGRKPVPPQPQPVSVGPASFIGSWLGYLKSQTLTGDQVDTLLGGPDRPVPTPKPQRPNVAASDSGSSRPQPDRANSVSEMANSASRGVSDLYSRLNNALAERGEMLGGLEESFQSLESGSKNMLSQAKTLAAKQTAKRWFQFS